MDWPRQSKPSLKVRRCKYMFIGNEKQLSKISDIGNLEIDKDVIKRVSKKKYLGLTSFENLLPRSQQYKISKGRVKGGLNSIRKRREILPQLQLFLVYQALIDSHPSYGKLDMRSFARKTLLFAEDTEQDSLPH